MIKAIGCLPVIVGLIAALILGQSVILEPAVDAVLPPMPAPFPTTPPLVTNPARIAAIEHAGYGWIAYYMGSYADAETEFTIAIERDPTWVDGYMGRAMSYIPQERWTEAERDLSKVIERDPNDAALYSGFRAYVRNLMGDFQGALDDCNTAIMLNPRLRANYSNRGWIESNMGRYEDAIADYTYAMTLNPEESFYYYQRANFSEMFWDLNGAEMDRYLMRGWRSFGCEMCDDAIAYLTLAANYEPAAGDRPADITYAYAWYGLGRQHFANANYDLALEAFTTAIDLAPALPHPYAWAGETAMALSDTESAAAYYDQAIAANPDYFDGYLLRARALDALGDHESALPDYYEYVRLMESRDLIWDVFPMGEPFIMALDEMFVHHIPVWGAAGQTLTVEVQHVWTPENNAEPLVLVLDAHGAVIAGDAVQSDYDEIASVEVTLPESGTYTVLVTHLAAPNGPARVTIALDAVDTNQDL
ncbi:MAG: tetratricopeptide repeat protein [Anaerolineae bacterium]|nr:tetratricopeptide repeat protein [Anaerolineae bacterium]